MANQFHLCRVDFIQSVAFLHPAINQSAPIAAHEESNFERDSSFWKIPFSCIYAAMNFDEKYPTPDQQHPASHWPKDVKRISLEGLDLLGIDSDALPSLGSSAPALGHDRERHSEKLLPETYGYLVHAE